MPSVDKFTIVLTPELSVLVKESIEQGDYDSTSEVIRDALRGAKNNAFSKKQGMEELCKLGDAGVKSGLGRFSNRKELVEEARGRLTPEKGTADAHGAVLPAARGGK